MTPHDTLRNRKRIFSDDVFVQEEQPDGVVSTTMKIGTNPNTIDAAARDWHTELLSGLFLRSNEQELNHLEKEVARNQRVDTATSEVKSAPQNLNSEQTACPGGATQHSLLPLIPSALLEIFPQQKADQDDFDRPLLIPESWRRPTYQSSTLLELEQQINNSDSVDENKVNDEGDAHVKRRKTSNDDEQNESTGKLMMPILYNECSLSAFANWAMMDPPDSFENVVEVTPSHSPQHNWDEYSREMTHQMANDCTTYEVPVLPRTYRKCGVCGNFGHYEVECDLLLDRDGRLKSTEQKSVKQTYLDEDRRRSIISELSKEIRVQRLLHSNIHMEESEEDNAAVDAETDFDEDDNIHFGSYCKICKSGLNDDMLVCDGCEQLFHPKCLDPPLTSPIPEGEWLCDDCLHYDSDQSSTVVIEGCGDFIVEQRKRSLAESSKHFGGISLGQHQCQWTAALSLMEESLPMVDRDYLHDHILDGYYTQRLFPGKLCWAKRFDGQLNRFDWWPAMILEPKAPSVHTVRFFGLNKKKNLLAANENVLPYLPYYEDIGFKRVSTKVHVHGEFCDALQLSLKALGLKSFAQALIIARNGVQNSLGTDPLNNKAVTESTEKPSVTWDHAEMEKVDDFVILSKETETISIEQSPSKHVESLGSLNEAVQYQSNIRHDFYLEEVVGGIVSWSIHQDGTTLDDEPQYGCVLSINPANETALVRSIKVDETLNDHIQSNDTVIQVQYVGSTMWMPLSALRFVSSKPNSRSVVDFKATVKSRMNDEIAFHIDRCKAAAICREENTVEL